MSGTLVLAVESVIPADHPVSLLAIPLGLLFLSGSVYVLLWSNYGARKAAGIYGTAFFGFNLLLGVFWWFGGPGIVPGLGISNLPGQTADHYNPEWFGFEPGSERAQFFRGTNLVDEFQPVESYLDVADVEETALTDGIPLPPGTTGGRGTVVGERTVEHGHGRGQDSLAARKPASRSARMSSIPSIPTARRTRSGVTPAVSCSSGVSWEWVVDAGWMTRLRTSPMLAT